MKNKIQLLAIGYLLSVCCFFAQAQGTAFTYQGRLNDGANAANGRYDLRFALYDSSVLGTQQGILLTNSATAVSNGVFTVTLDFGNQYSGASRWLEIGVRTNGAANFFTLSPRQALTPAPYAITAGSVISGGLAAGTYGNAITLNNAANQVTGSFTGNGASVTNVNAATLNGIPSGGFWKTNGNAGANPASGAFLGTSDNSPLEIKVNGQRALRLEPNGTSPNVIGGYPGNVVSNGYYGAFIGGGGNLFGLNQVGNFYASVLGGYGNLADGYGSTVMGAYATASGYYSTAMGVDSTASGNYSTAMGYITTASGDYSTAMGQNSVASGLDSVSAGLNNVASGINSVAMGETCLATNLAATAMGYHNIAGAPGSTALGVFSHALHNNTFVWSDGSPAIPFASSAANQFLVYASGGVGINTASPLAQLAVNGNTRIDAAFGGYSEGLVLNCPPDFGGYGGILFHNAARGAALGSGTIKWAVDYGYSPETGIGGTGLAFIQNNTSSRLYLAANGNVGVGTTSPQSALHVKSPAIDCELSIESGDAGGHRWSLQSSAPGAFGQYASSFQIIDRTMGVSRALIDTNGNVGIGTTTPAAKLEVHGDVKVGNSGQYYAAAGAENLRIVRGRVNADGTIAQGTGFTVNHLGTGYYALTFNEAFNEVPVLTVTPYGGNVEPELAHIFYYNGGTNQVKIFMFRGVPETAVGVYSAEIGANNFIYDDAAWNFIAISSR